MGKNQDLALANTVINLITGIGRRKFDDARKAHMENSELLKEQRKYGMEIQKDALQNAYTRMNDPALPYHERIDNWNFYKKATGIDVPQPSSEILPFAEEPSATEQVYGDPYKELNQKFLDDPTLYGKQQKEIAAAETNKALTRKRNKEADKPDDDKSGEYANQLVQIDKQIDDYRAMLGTYKDDMKNIDENNPEVPIIRNKIRELEEQREEIRKLLPGYIVKESEKIKTPEQRKSSANNYFLELQKAGIPADSARKMIKQKFGI